MLEKKEYSNGQPVYMLKDNVLTYYFKNGNKKSKGKYENELMEGKWKFYRENSQLWQIGHFSAGVKHGKWIRYDENGEVEYEEEFFNGKIVK